MGLTLDNRYLFTLDGRRDKLHIGRTVTRKTAAKIAMRLNRIIERRNAGEPVDEVDSQWLLDLGNERLRTQLQQRGLIQNRHRFTMGEWLTLAETTRGKLRPTSHAKSNKRWLGCDWLCRPRCPCRFIG